MLHHSDNTYDAPSKSLSADTKNVLFEQCADSMCKMPSKSDKQVDLKIIDAKDSKLLPTLEIVKDGEKPHKPFFDGYIAPSKTDDKGHPLPFKPGFEKPGVDKPGIKPEFDKPGAFVKPGDKIDWSKPEFVKPGFGKPELVKPEFEKPGFEKPGYEKPEGKEKPPLTKEEIAIIIEKKRLAAEMEVKPTMVKPNHPIWKGSIENH